MKRELTKRQLQQKYSDAKREIIRLHDECAALRVKTADADAGARQLCQSMDAVLIGIVLEHGADTGRGHELYISAAEIEEVLQSWTLSVARTDANRLRLRVQGAAPEQ